MKSLYGECKRERGPRSTITRVERDVSDIRLVASLRGGCEILTPGDVISRCQCNGSFKDKASILIGVIVINQTYAELYVNLSKFTRRVSRLMLTSLLSLSEFYGVLEVNACMNIFTYIHKST
ncbi:PREDICTED: uncharacterized protein LOC106126575 [Papilio xuthus]|uniref:Uncharacterized protein LOC106126575 n=1 Tax=Papilio xuthus TaxID=66420 RepID=A0AAJ7EJI6_PAPXU|nr:PREDICTED: uncharacterized protein LOC106126575 [Papilio xuthus]